MHQRTTYFEFTKNMLEVLCIVICICGVLLLLGLGYLQIQLGDVKGQIAVADSRYIQKNRDADALNSLLTQTETIQRQYIHWIPILTEIAAAIPQSVQVDRLTIEWDAKKLSIAGTAPSRDDLLAIKTNLSALSWVKPFDIPIEQLIEKNNLPFALSLTLR
jgi:Tfp pilus assembly protein PilN